MQLYGYEGETFCFNNSYSKIMKSKKQDIICRQLTSNGSCNQNQIT